MGKYIKLFESHSDYETYASSEEYIEPHVSYCEDDGCVQYNKKGTRTITITQNDYDSVRYSIDGIEYSIASGEIQEREIKDSIVILDGWVGVYDVDGDQIIQEVRQAPGTVIIPKEVSHINLYALE